jgi:hypothetical protein
MQAHGVLVLTLALVGAAAAAACSGPDPGAIEFIERTRGGGPGEPGGPGPGDPDGGGVDPDGPITPFSAAGPYAEPATTDPSDNPNHGGAGDPAGQNCLDCHIAGGAAGEKPWAIGGTIFTLAGAGGTPVARAEVRMVDPTGKEVLKTYSNDDGNFWVPAELVPGGIPAGSLIGVRNADKERLMSTALAGPDDGSCQRAGCHVTGAQGNVFLDP